jgi:hypothetical protein
MCVIDEIPLTVREAVEQLTAGSSDCSLQVTVNSRFILPSLVLPVRAFVRGLSF